MLLKHITSLFLILKMTSPLKLIDQVLFEISLFANIP